MRELSALESKASARLFVALWPDGEMRSRLARLRDALCPPPGSTVFDADLHVTLHFIGAVDRDRIQSISSTLSQVRARPVLLTSTKLAVWQRGTVVLQLEGDDALAALHAETGAALRTCGVTLDTRPFAPHVTLARKAARVQLPSAPERLEWRATAFALAESVRVSGPRNRVLGRIGDA